MYGNAPDDALVFRDGALSRFEQWAAQAAPAPIPARAAGAAARARRRDSGNCCFQQEDRVARCQLMLVVSLVVMPTTVSAQGAWHATFLMRSSPLQTVSQ
jgi:hypothetical protein